MMPVHSPSPPPVEVMHALYQVGGQRFKSLQVELGKLGTRAMESMSRSSNAVHHFVMVVMQLVETSPRTRGWQPD